MCAETDVSKFIQEETAIGSQLRLQVVQYLFLRSLALELEALMRIALHTIHPLLFMAI